jgi:hypothetical protein
LRPLEDLLFGGFGSYPHPLFLCERLIGAKLPESTSTAVPGSVS